jgi:hypothetical protein
MINDMVLGVIKLISPKQIVRLIMIGLHGQTISGYGVTTTLNFPKDKREEIIKEVFGG